MPTERRSSAPDGLTALVRLQLVGFARVAPARAARLAAELFARSLGHVFPFVAGVVLGRLAGARVARRAAIVLAGFRDAVALLLGAGALRVIGDPRVPHAPRPDPRTGGPQQHVPR